MWVLEDWWPTIRGLTLCQEFCRISQWKRQYERAIKICMAYNEEKGKSHEHLWGLGRLYFMFVLGALYYQGGCIEWVGEVQIIEILSLIQLARTIRTYPVSWPGSSKVYQKCPGLPIFQSAMHIWPLSHVPEKIFRYVWPQDRAYLVTFLVHRLNLLTRIIWMGHWVTEAFFRHIRSLDWTCPGNPFPHVAKSFAGLIWVPETLFGHTQSLDWTCPTSQL
jgi:hypothetical protein